VVALNSAGVKVGVVYFTLKNDTGKSDRLLKISSPVAENVQVHRTEILDGIARMREVAVLHVEQARLLNSRRTRCT
jgi:copper(I)-binding protein